MQKDLTINDFEDIIESVRHWNHEWEKFPHSSQKKPMSKHEFAKYLKQIFDERREKKIGILFRKESFWIGLHYSKANQRFCLNIIPCVTIWWTKKGGVQPDISKM